MASCENFLRAFACSATTRADKELRLIVQKWAQLTCSSLLSALPPPSSASALLGAPPRSAGTEHSMLESNAMRAFHWSSATRFGSIFFLGPVVFLMWRSLYMYNDVRCADKYVHVRCTRTMYYVRCTMYDVLFTMYYVRVHSTCSPNICVTQCGSSSSQSLSLSVV